MLSDFATLPSVVTSTLPITKVLSILHKGVGLYHHLLVRILSKSN